MAEEGAPEAEKPAAEGRRKTGIFVVLAVILLLGGLGAGGIAYVVMKKMARAPQPPAPAVASAPAAAFPPAAAADTAPPAAQWLGGGKAETAPAGTTQGRPAPAPAAATAPPPAAAPPPPPPAVAFLRFVRLNTDTELKSRVEPADLDNFLKRVQASVSAQLARGEDRRGRDIAIEVAILPDSRVEAQVYARPPLPAREREALRSIVRDIPPARVKGIPVGALAFFTVGGGAGRGPYDDTSFLAARRTAFYRTYARLFQIAREAMTEKPPRDTNPFARTLYSRRSAPPTVAGIAAVRDDFGVTRNRRPRDP